MIRQAVILCAGLGTRLRPFTDSTPKPMLPILHTPMLEWNIRRFAEFGIDEFFINLHYLPEPLRAHFGDGSKWGVRVRYHFEPEILGTAGGVKSFESQLDDEFFVIYGDIFSMANYAAMEQAWRERGHGLGMQRVRPTTEYSDADVVELNASGRVIAVHPKPHGQTYENAYRMAGIFILTRKSLEYIPAGVYRELGRDLIPAVLRRDGEFWGYVCDDYSKGIDTLNKKEEVEAYLAMRGICAPTGVSAAKGEAK